MMFVGKNAVKGPNDEIYTYLRDIKKHSTVTEKIKQLCDLSCLTLEEKNFRTEIRRNVYYLLNNYYKDCQVFIFGSTNNGFGTKGSDLDLLFLPYPEYCKSGTEDEAGEKRGPTLAQIHKGEVPMTQLTQMSEKNQLEFVRRVLRKNLLFKKIVYIPAKCPILNFFVSDAKKSFLSCDLSCRNSLVLSNTDLFTFFKRIDQRVKPLVITLRFWAKAVGVIKTESLSSYAFTLLVIFFLQNVNPPILPSVSSLMEMSKSSRIVAGWEVSFVQDLNKVPKTENRNTEGELLQKFFSFFWNFDFIRNVASVRTGRELPIEELKNSHNEGFVMSALCIQDPFVLSHNVGKNVNPDNLFHFKSSLLMAKETLNVATDCKMDNCTFASLFDAKLLKDKIENIFYCHESNSTELLIYLNQEIINSLGDGKNILKKWYARASEAVLELLNYGLLINCEVIDKGDFILNKCVEDKADISEYQNCLLTIQCAIYDRVWVNRNSTKVLPDVSDTEVFSNVVLQTQHQLSRNIIHSNPYLSCIKPIIWFLCTCYKTDFIQLPHLIVVLSPLTKCKEYHQVCKFLSSFIPKMVTQMLIEAD